MTPRLQRFFEIYDRYPIQSDEERLYFATSRPKFARIIELMDVGPEARVLEIGSSMFSGVLKQIEPSWDIHSLDLTHGHADECRRNGVEFCIGNVLEPLPEHLKNFDVVLFSEVIEHLQGNPRLAMRHLLTALRPGGILLVTTPNLSRLMNRVKLLLGLTPLEFIGEPGTWGGHFREYILSELREFANAEGFQIDRAEHSLHWDSASLYLSSGVRGFDKHGNYSYRPRFGGWKKPLGYVYGAILTAVARRFPTLRHALVMVARRPG